MLRLKLIKQLSAAIHLNTAHVHCLLIDCYHTCTCTVVFGVIHLTIVFTITCVMLGSDSKQNGMDSTL